MTQSRVQHRAGSNGRAVHPSDAAIGALQLPSELEASEGFVQRHGEDLLFCGAAGGWFEWDGKRFAHDQDGAVMRRAAEHARKIEDDAGGLSDPGERRKWRGFAIKMQRSQGLKNMVEIAKSHQRVAIGDPRAFDANPFLLNVRNGTIDLRSGTLLPHRRSDRITKLVEVDYLIDAKCPRWEQFLQEIFGGDDDLIAFIRRAIGYSLTGDISEHNFLLLYGIGANGKSTFVETSLAMFGGYGQSSSSEMWLRQSSGGRGPEPDVARLPGIRMVATAEIGEGRALDETRVKSIVAGDRTTTHAKYCDPFEFIPSCKLWISTNHRPQIRGTDDGIWRRVLLVPFTQQFIGDACDPQLREKLLAELPGVLRWAVLGGLEWQRDGLRPPAAVRSATATYRAESDVLAQFLADACVINDNGLVGASELYGGYRRWCESCGERPAKQRSFGLRLGERGYVHGPRRSTGETWRGIGLASEESVPCAP